MPIHIEPDIHAIVLDTSAGGLGFRALTPLEQAGAVRFSFADSERRMEASGDLVWIDEGRKKGGLSFASMSQADRDRIRHWINSPLPEPALSVTDQAASPPGEFPVPSAPDANPAPPSAPILEFPPASLPPQGVALMPYGEPYSYESSRSGFLPGVAAGMVLSGLLITVTYFALYGGLPATLLARWQGPNGASASPPVATATPQLPPAPQVGETPSPGQPADGQAVQPVELPPEARKSPATSADAAGLPQTPSDTSPELQPEENSAPATATPATQAPGAGEVELATARRYLNQNAGIGDHAAAARLLWRAVEKGNVQAEVLLGGLYARGDGVTRNCDQASILLRAAAERGSQEGSEQLARLVRSGCR